MRICMYIYEDNSIEEFRSVPWWCGVRVAESARSSSRALQRGFRNVPAIKKMATGHAQTSRQASSNLILKEGFLYKKGGLIKSWTRRYFILTGQSLCYFRRETQEGVQEGLEPMGRVFLSDIVDIQTDGVEKRKAFVFALHTRKRAVLLQAANSEDRDKWVHAIHSTLESDKEAEHKDPFRKTLRRLARGLKRVTLVKDPDKGIGCTIKNAAGHIFVNRIIEDGPIALTGVLRPGDEILDIHGSTVTGLAVAEVVVIIRAAPEQFLATVRPITALKKGHVQDTGRITYSDIVPQASSNGTVAPQSQAIGQSSNKGLTTSQYSLDDVGNYDDEDEGDTPPPLPPRTEDALILVDPPPSHDPPSLPPKPRSSEHLVALTQQNSAHDLTAQQARAKLMMQKSYSQGDSLDLDDAGERGSGGGSSGGYQRRRRVHHYEEIKPKIVYADIDYTPRGVGQAHTMH